MSNCHHVANKHSEKYILKRTEDGSYFPLTAYRCAICGVEFFGDGLWWVMQGIPANVIFKPEPEQDEIIIDYGICKGKARREKQATF